MLDPKSLDLDELCAALDDHSPDATWWIHTGDGRIRSGWRPAGDGLARDRLGRPRTRATGTWPSSSRACTTAGPPSCWTARSPGAARSAGSRTPSSSSPSCASSGSATATPARGGGRVRWLADEGLVERAVADRVDGALPRPGPADEEDVPAARRRRPRPALRRPAAAGAAVRRLGPRGGRGRGRHRARRRAVRPALAAGKSCTTWTTCCGGTRERAGLAVVAVPVTAEEWPPPAQPAAAPRRRRGGAAWHDRDRPRPRGAVRGPPARHHRSSRPSPWRWPTAGAGRRRGRARGARPGAAHRPGRARRDVPRSRWCASAAWIPTPDGWLRALHNRAVLADADGGCPRRRPPRAIADATAVVDAVDDWLTHSRVRHDRPRVAPAGRPAPPSPYAEDAPSRPR